MCIIYALVALRLLSSFFCSCTGEGSFRSTGEAGFAAAGGGATTATAAAAFAHCVGI